MVNIQRNWKQRIKLYTLKRNSLVKPRAQQNWKVKSYWSRLNGNWKLKVNKYSYSSKRLQHKSSIHNLTQLNFTQLFDDRIILKKWAQNDWIALSVVKPLKTKKHSSSTKRTFTTPNSRTIGIAPMQSTNKRTVWRSGSRSGKISRRAQSLYNLQIILSFSNGSWETQQSKTWILGISARKHKSTDRKLQNMNLKHSIQWTSQGLSSR